MVLKKDEIMEQIKGIIGENTDDASLKFLEDVSDTFNDLETKAKGDGEDWKQKYEDNDKEWRKKYQERFFNGTTEDDGAGKKDILEPDNPEPEKETEDEPLHFEDLFTES